MLGFLYDCVNYGVQILVWLIIIRVLMSYFPHDPNKGVSSFIYSMTDPFYNMAGKILPMSLRAPLDFAPLVALVILEFLVRPALLYLVVALM